MMVAPPGGYGISAMRGAGGPGGAGAVASGAGAGAASAGAASAGGADGAAACASSLRAAAWRRGNPGPRGKRLSRCPGSPRRCAPRDDEGMVPCVIFSSGPGTRSGGCSAACRWCAVSRATSRSRANSRSRARARLRWAMRCSVRVWARTSLASASRRSTMNQRSVAGGYSARRSRQRFQPSMVQITGGGPGSGVRAARWRRRVSAQARRSASKRMEARVASRCRRTSACQSPWLARL